MPFAETACRVAVLAKQLGDHGGLKGNRRVIPRKTVRNLGNAAHVCGVMVASSQHGSSGR